MMCALRPTAHSTAATQASSSTRVSVPVNSVLASRNWASGATPSSLVGARAATSDQVAVPCAISPCASPGSSRTVLSL